MTLWILYSILSAWTWSTSDFFSKKVLILREADEVYLIGFRYWIAIPFLLPIFFLTRIPHLDPVFWKLQIVWLPVEVIATYLYLRAIKISPLSLTLPLLSLTPLFLLLTSRIILGEISSPRATIGIFLIVVGSYLLYFEKGSEGVIGPFKRFLKEKGSILMLIVAFLYSLTSVFGKILISHSSPLFFSAYYPIVMTLVLTPLSLKGGKRELKRGSKDLFWAGFFFAFMILFHMLALYRAKVAYMIALKRLSGVFGVLYGWIFFKEKLRMRLLAALIMVIGAFLVSGG